MWGGGGVVVVVVMGGGGGGGVLVNWDKYGSNMHENYQYQATKKYYKMCIVFIIPSIRIDTLDYIDALHTAFVLRNGLLPVSFRVTTL